MTQTDNPIRAERCDGALARYGTGSPDENLIDLLTDAMHWCDTTPFNFHVFLAQACRHYINELNGDQQDERRMGPTSATQPSNPIDGEASARAMPPHILNALKLVLEHYYRDELDHYESGGNVANHIFHSLNRLNHWVTTQL